MARVKRYLDSRTTDSHERWLVSYADFITLLFAFFVVMYALSSVNEGKYRVMGTAIGAAFGTAEPGSASQPPRLVQGRLAQARGEAAIARHRERVAQVDGALRSQLTALAAKGEARTARHARGVTVEIGAGALFAPGQAALREDSLALLGALAEALREGDEPIEVEGHTDDAPIRSPLFASNWELSAARASSVVRLFAERGVAPQRLAAIGLGEFRPVAPNTGAEQRARNRRVAITVVAPDPATRGSDPTQPFQPMEFQVQPR